MPGTIQVSVLDFAGSHSSSSEMQRSIKVSMGKREYETREKGEFSFPLTSMRDNLVVILRDKDGSEVSRTEVETKLVIEKGVWDHVFPLQGEGHVHMNLQFVLSEEDREKIRVTRQLALKKKQEELLKREAKSPAVAATSAERLVQPKNEASGKSSQEPHEIPSRGEKLAQLFKRGKRIPEDTNIGHSLQMQMRPNNVDTIGEISSTSHTRQQFEVPSVSSAAMGKGVHVKAKGHEVDDSEKQNSLKKTPSNVRNMISAFESRPYQQDTNPRAKSPTTLTAVQLSKDKEEASWKTGSDEGNITAQGEQVGFFRTKIGVKHKEVNIEERSSSGRRASGSGRLPDEPSSRRPFSDFFSKRRISGVSLLPRRSGEGTKPRICNDVEVKQTASNEHFLHESSGAWILPEGRYQCFTTASKTIMSLMRDSPQKKVSYTEVSMRQENSVQGDPQTASKIPTPMQHGVSDPPDDESSSGPFRQVIKVVIMVGFATLVVLTRQRNPDR